MKKTSAFFILFVLCLLFSSCTGKFQGRGESDNTLPDHILAKKALINFFDHLYAGRYKQAAGLYGGSYDILTAWNQEIDPFDYESLLQAACSINGSRCLKVKSAVFNKEISHDEWEFYVKFQEKSGYVFVLWPCCGEGESGSSPQTVFSYKVKKTIDGSFLVMALPPYAP